MGGLFSKLLKQGGTTEPKKILMVGLDNAGKTTILYTLHLGETVTKTVPTIGFNVQTVIHKNLEMSVWDVGGQSKIRGLWRHYLKGIHAVIYVVDSSDKARLTESGEEFQNLLKEEELKEACVLVMANKRDIASLSLQEVKEGLGCNRISQRCHVEGTVATKNEGLDKALDWVSEQLLGGFDAPPQKPKSVPSKKISRLGSASLRLPVLTQSESSKATEFKSAPLVVPHPTPMEHPPSKQKKNQPAEPPSAEPAAPAPVPMSTSATTSMRPDSNGPAEMSTSASQQQLPDQQSYPLVLTWAEASEMMKLPKDEVLELLKQGSIKGKLIGNDWRISTRTILEWLEE